MNKKHFGIILRITLAGLIVYLLFQHFYIKDFRVMAQDALYVCNQPRGLDYTRLHYKYHIATIVNVRSSLEHLEKNWRNEEFLCTKDLAIQYVEIPIDRQNYFPDIEQQKTFLAIMSNKENLPILLHGYNDDERVAMLAAVWFRKQRGLTAEETQNQIKKIVDDRPLTSQEIEFIKSLR